jgi:hypothetical protein
MSAFLRLNLNQGSVSFRFHPEAALALQMALGNLRERFKVAAGQEKGQSSPLPTWEFQNREFQAEGDAFFEVFCNPNIWANPFAAKVLLTIKDDQIQVRAETELTQLQDDLEEYLAQN